MGRSRVKNVLPTDGELAAQIDGLRAAQCECAWLGKRRSIARH
jgi:hypothetical protein